MNILVSACLLGVHCRYNGTGEKNAAVWALSKRHSLIPFCPEVYGGLATPREPAEVKDGRVITKSGVDVTAQYERGAQEALKIARLYRCTCAVLQERSPSCGYNGIHDGNFEGGMTLGDGLTASLLLENGITVIPVSQIATLERLCCPCTKRCVRKGDCEACARHHEGAKNPPFCKR